MPINKGIELTLFVRCPFPQRTLMDDESTTNASLIRFYSLVNQTSNASVGDTSEEETTKHPLSDNDEHASPKSSPKESHTTSLQTSAHGFLYPKRRIDLSTLPSSGDSDTFRMLARLLEYSPPPFLIAPNHTRSTGTRAPGAFDMHAPPELRLERIVFCPELLQNTVDKAITKLLDLERSGFFKDHASPCSNRLEYEVLLDHERELVDETNLTKRVEQLLLGQCARASGIIGLGVVPSTETSPEALLTKQWDSQGTANPDISIQFAPDAAKHYPAVAERIQKLYENRLTDYVVFEFKSLVVGTEDFVDGVIHSPWTGWVACLGSCKHDQYHNGREKQDDIVFGPDADISEYLGFAPLPLDEHRDKHVTSGELSGLDYHIFCARQQLFTEMMHKNATFAVGFFGNFVFMAARDRDGQTMYMSPKLSLSDQPEGQIPLGLLLTSIMVAGIDDALCRVAAANEQTYESEHEAPIPRVTDSIQDAHPTGKILTDGVIKKQPSKGNPNRAREAARRQASGPKRLKPLGKRRKEELLGLKRINVQLGANIPVSGSYGVFMRETEDGIRTTMVEGDNPKIYSFRTNREHGRAWSMKPFDSEGSYSDRMFIKAATNPYDIRELRKEYKAYMELTRKGYKHVVKVYGLFTYITPNQVVSCALLLMDDGGEPLSDVILEKQSPRYL
ncbi:hypothetical protein BJ165DRAFT_1405838 [Panaeolus papilionaceus]|nr:hypothetical protein BJ165DRAFT_1405838 [Panaeolus papilionaceus]